MGGASHTPAAMSAVPMAMGCCWRRWVNVRSRLRFSSSLGKLVTIRLSRDAIYAALHSQVWEIGEYFSTIQWYFMALSGGQLGGLGTPARSIFAFLWQPEMMARNAQVKPTLISITPQQQYNHLASCCRSLYAQSHDAIDYIIVVLRVTILSV